MNQLAKSTSTITSRTSKAGSPLTSFTDAASEVVAKVLAGIQRDAATERLLRDSEHRARMAELDALIVSVKAQQDALTARMASVKDGTSVSLADVTEFLINAVQTTLPGMVEEAFDNVPLPENGKDGQSIDPVEVRRFIDEAVASVSAPLPELVLQIVNDAVALIPKPENGKDADTELIRVMVEECVSTIPKPENGKDADPELIRVMVDEAVALIPKPENGKDAEPEAILSIVQEEVERAVRIEGNALTTFVDQKINEAVALIPIPENGKDADPELIREMVHEAVALIPKPENGKDADPEVIREMVDEAVAALPKPKDGAPGLMPIAREWEDKVSYQGDVVTHLGSTWQALRDTGREPPHQDWICLAVAGALGRSPKVRGTWDNSTGYSELDIVALHGAAFIARRDNPGDCPGDGWQMIAAQGKTGKPGTGLRGPQGQAGPAGPSVIGMDIDSEGLLVITNSDGTVVQCDLYPVLSKL